MLHLIKYNIMVKIRCMNVVFWPLVFPLILGTLFYFAFGNIEEADFETVKAAVVEEENADAVFLEFLEAMEEEDAPLIQVQNLSEQDALDALKEQKVEGIYFVGEELSLSVGGNGIPESILQSLLESYENGKQTMELVARRHPEGITAAAEQMGAYEELVEQVSLGGRTTNGNVQFFTH